MSVEALLLRTQSPSCLRLAHHVSNAQIRPVSFPTPSTKAR